MYSHMMEHITSRICDCGQLQEVALSESESFAAGDDPPKIPKGKRDNFV